MKRFRKKIIDLLKQWPLQNP